MGDLSICEFSGEKCVAMSTKCQMSASQDNFARDTI